jgi:hypothetical protein
MPKFESPDSQDLKTRFKLSHETTNVRTALDHSMISEPEGSILLTRAVQAVLSIPFKSITNECDDDETPWKRPPPVPEPLPELPLFAFTFLTSVETATKSDLFVPNSVYTFPNSGLTLTFEGVNLLN